jgi:phage-related protein
MIPRVATILGGIVQMLPKIIGDIISHIPEWTGQIAESIQASLPGLIQGVAQTFGIDFDSVMSSRLFQSVLGLGTKIQETFTKVFGDIDLGSVAGGMQTAFQTAGDVISQVITSISDSITALIEGIDPATLEAIFSTLRQVGETLLSVMATLGEQVVNVIVNLIIPTITTLWSFLEQVVLPGAMQIFETLRPGFEFVIGMIAQVAGWIAQLVSALVDLLAPVIAMIFEIAAPVISGILAGIADIWNSIFTAVKDIWNTISPFVTRLVSDLSAVFTTIGKLIRAVWPVVSWVCNQIGQGISIVVRTITSMVSGLISGIGHIISGIIGTITGIITVIMDLVTGNFDALERDFAGLVNSIGNIFWGVIEIITSPFRYAFSQIRSLWNSTVGSLHFSVPDCVPGIGGNSFGMPKLASGGNIVGAGSVLVGEAGPELLTLPRGARVTPLKSSDAVSGGTTYSVVVGDVDITDDDQVKRVTRDYLEFLAGLARPAGVVSV